MQLFTIDKPELDQRHYRGLVLENGLRCVLISDPLSQKAACILNLKVGSEHDPDEWPGLAHMLEHGVFLGSKKFPDKGSFDELIHRYGGEVHAETQDSITQYGFDIECTMLDAAFEQFIALIYHPLLSDGSITKERSAVDAEFHQYKNSDDYRLSYVLYSVLTNQAHPLSRFNIGNHKTLADKPKQSLGQAVREFHAEHYNAQNSDIILIGAASLDVLQALALQHLKALPKGTKSTNSQQTLLDEAQLCKDIYIRPKENNHTLSFHFPLPFSAELERTKSLDILGHLFNLKGIGSLYDQLRKKGWITDLTAHSQRVCHTQAEFYVECDLTLLGREHAETITAYFFNYCDFLRACSLEDYYSALEQADKNAYRFYDEQDPLESAIDLIEHFESYPMQDLLSGGYLMKVTDDVKERVKNLLARLVPSKMRRISIDKKLPTDKIDPLYQVHYQSKGLLWVPPATLAPTDYPYQLPSFTQFIPKDFSIETHAPHEIPVQLVKKENFELWGMVDTTYERPKVDTLMYWIHPTFGQSAKEEAGLLLLADSLNEACLLIEDPLHLAGCEVSFEACSFGIMVSISGYTDGHQAVLKEILSIIEHHTLEKNNFEVDKKQWIEELEDLTDTVPVEQAYELAEQLLSFPEATTPELLTAMKTMTIDIIEAQLNRLKTECYIKALCHGSLNLEAIKTLGDLIPQHPCVINPNTCQPTSLALAEKQFYAHSFTNSHTDLSVVLYYQTPTVTHEERACIGLLEKLLAPAFFHYARTESELGYTAECDVLKLPQHTGLVFALQSPHATLQELMGIIDSFIHEQATELLTMLENEEYRSTQLALNNALLEKPSYLTEKTAELFDDLIHLRTQFDDTQVLAKTVMTIKLEALRAFFYKVFMKTPRRLICTNSKELLPGMERKQ